jgi:hypothetical protein
VGVGQKAGLAGRTVTVPVQSMADEVVPFPTQNWNELPTGRFALVGGRKDVPPRIVVGQITFRLAAVTVMFPGSSGVTLTPAGNAELDVVRPTIATDAAYGHLTATDSTTTDEWLGRETFAEIQEVLDPVKWTEIGMSPGRVRTLTGSGLAAVTET